MITIVVMADIEIEMRAIDGLVKEEVLRFIEYAGSFNETTVQIIKDYDVITLWLNGVLDTVDSASEDEIDFGIGSSEEED